MMEPTDGASVQSKAPTRGRRLIDHDLRSVEFLSMLPPPPPATASTEESTTDDDDSSTATSLSLNPGSRRSRGIERLQHLSLDDPAVLGEARRMATANYIYWMQEATTSPTNVELTYLRKTSDCLTTKEQPASLMDWVVQQQQSNPYCVDFNLWDDHRSSTAGSIPEHVEEREDASENGADATPPRDSKGTEKDNDENDSPEFEVNTVASNNPHEGVVVIVSTNDKGQRRLSLGRVPLTPTQQSHKGGSCGSSDLTSSVCDSIALTSYHGGDDWDEEDAFLEKTLGRRQSTQTIVTNRNAWRSAFASGGGVPSIRVYADPRDLYSNRQNVVARQCWW